LPVYFVYILRYTSHIFSAMNNIDQILTTAHIATALLIIAFVLVVTVLRKTLERK
jgi:hypothetical protein